MARAINEVLEKLAATSEERDEVQAALARKQREATALKSEVTRLSSENQNIRVGAGRPRLAPHPLAHRRNTSLPFTALSRRRALLTRKQRHKSCATT